MTWTGAEAAGEEEEEGEEGGGGETTGLPDPTGQAGPDPLGQGERAPLRRCVLLADQCDETLPDPRANTFVKGRGRSAGVALGGGHAVYAALLAYTVVYDT